MRTLLSTLLGVALTIPASAAVVGIDSVVAGTSGSPPYDLQSITVGSYTVGIDQLGVGTIVAQPGGTDGGNFFGTWEPPFDPPAPAATLDLNDILARNANPNPIIVTAFGGSDWVNVNGANPDFFIFEAAAGGNVDGDVTVQAILPGSILGMEVALPGGMWGATGLSRSGNPNNGHPIKGVAFGVEDLLDDSGNALTAAAVLEGLQINSAGLDPSLVAAVVPEPGTLALFGLAGGLAACAWFRRRR